MQNLYNVIIIDDEPFVLDVMTDSFSWDKYGFKVVATFSDSVDALEYVKNNGVDVILSDIRMPEIDGLKLTRCVKSINPNITVILISAYTDFEYAREAIKLGVFEYITKPIDFNVLEQLCDKLSRSLHVKHSRKKPSFNIDAQKTIKKLLNSSELNDISDAENKLKEIIPDLSSGYIFIFTIVLTNIDSLFNNIYNSTLDELYNSINAIVTDYEDFTIIPLQTNFDEITYIVFSDVLSFEQFIEDTNQFVVIISEKIYSEHNLIFSVNYNCVSETFDEFIQQYHSMNTAKMLCALAWDSIKNGRLSEAAHNYSHINELCHNNNNNNMLRKSIAVQLYQILSKNISIDKLKEFEIYPTDIMFPIEMDIFNIPVEISKITDYLEKTITNATKYFSSPKKYDPFINSTIAYIDEHYAENISLSYLANASFMSESYFCVMFKNQTGTTVVNYINSVRIKNAKILLRTTNMSTNDIAVATGFQNVRYFYKKFKEFTGYTTGDYRITNSDMSDK